MKTLKALGITLLIIVLCLAAPIAVAIVSTLLGGLAVIAAAVFIFAVIKAGLDSDKEP
ncbi:hypothetical protein VOWphi5012_025 [Vibrio phage phi50-12]|uniref:Uncharacterized protein n=1 Tax=Vibrio phage phi50-12 TaxID=2654972 RepID=A0A5P8PRB5_9CAUD|nr:hypothetical protein KNU82_gp025 [Vibrio phage phi50-12]QFR59809.1 hypothetical protein VOWphi5012_025 [Vibrio phage phi50-12]